MRRICIFILFMGLASTFSLSQQVNRQNQERLKETADVLKEVTSGNKMFISKKALTKAKCIVVIPSAKRVAFIFGVDYGRGAMTCRLGEDFNGPWSAPSMYSLAGGSFGFQGGIASTDLVLLVMNKRGVDSLLRTRSKLAGAATGAAGPFGRNWQAGTDLGMRAEILGFSKAHGVFVGVTVDLSALHPDGYGNMGLYKRDLSPRLIVRSGEIPVPVEAAEMIQVLDRSAPTAAQVTAPSH